ncbi:MAG: tRNA (adenosine(37)-N6)-dimethylallyltransferase MiaA [Sedimentisphaerales bacterium]|nr:tRNA (adenosine(37)-N6)-dimethylallyltransferase MiaA [Sedimentisphaerales bacterium]
MNCEMVLILGVTASGKGRLAFELAKSLDAEIISVDSMKVYRRMDIGTAKPPKDAREQVKYHLIDIAEPSESFSVARFLELADNAVEQIKGRNKPVIAVGGTALYIKALLFGLFRGPASNEKVRAHLKAKAHSVGLQQLWSELESVDPAAASRIHPNDVRRIIRALEVYEVTGKPISEFQQQWPNGENKLNDPASVSWTIIGLHRDKSLENRRINERVRKMISAGFVDEVRSLLTTEEPLSHQARCAIGYAEMIEHIAGKISLNDAVELIKTNTRRLAKNQRTWFKTFPNIHWLDIEANQSEESILNRTKNLVSQSKK